MITLSELIRANFAIRPKADAGGHAKLVGLMHALPLRSFADKLSS
jgi:hypothetical protein